MCTKCMSNKVLKLNDLSSISIDALIDFYKNGYTIEKSNYITQENVAHIKNLATCADKVQGTTELITLVPSGGTPPYKFELFVDSVLKNTLTNKTGLTTVSYTFNESIGSHIFMTKMTDSCAPTPQVITDSCTINITAPVVTKYKCIDNVCTQDSTGSYNENTCDGTCTTCVPNWTCKSPLDGYETDGCGNVRANSVCNASTVKCIPKEDEYYIPTLNVCVKKTHAMIAAALVTVLIAT